MLRVLHRWRRRATGDRGSALGIWLVIISLAATMLLAIVVDGGHKMASEREAQRVAEQAARLASDQLTLESARAGGSEIDPVQASTAVQSYLGGTDMSGAVDVNGNSVTVTIHTSYQTHFLAAFGMDTLAVEASANAQSIDADDTPGTL